MSQSKNGFMERNSKRLKTFLGLYQSNIECLNLKKYSFQMANIYKPAWICISLTLGFGFMFSEFSVCSRETVYLHEESFVLIVFACISVSMFMLQSPQRHITYIHKKHWTWITISHIWVCSSTLMPEDGSIRPLHETKSVTSTVLSTLPSDVTRL